jgi:hypothetical protein
LLHLLDSLPQADAFEAAGDRDIALQVLAADLRLAGLLLNVRQRPQRRSLPRGADQQPISRYNSNGRLADLT